MSIMFETKVFNCPHCQAGTVFPVYGSGKAFRLQCRKCGGLSVFKVEGDVLSLAVVQGGPIQKLEQSSDVPEVPNDN